MNTWASLTISERVAVTLEGLCKAVAARIKGGAMSAVMIVLVWTRIRRIEGKFQKLLARFRAGRLRARPAVARGPGTREGGTREGGAREGGGRKGGAPAGVPRHFGWLLQAVPYEAAGFASQLRHMLAEPEMVALLRASPQARRVLAPLCRMLAIEASLLEPCGLQDMGSPEEPAPAVAAPVAAPVAASVAAAVAASAPEEGAAIVPPVVPPVRPASRPGWRVSPGGGPAPPDGASVGIGSADAVLGQAP
jgi:hypothetical protein